MKPRLHHVAQARSFRTLWLMHEMGLEVEVVHHSFFDRSLRDPDYLALSPAGRVPALEIDGRVLFESGAITEYLCETRPEAGLGRLPPDAERLEWLEWLHFAETIGQHIANLTQQHIVLREDQMRSPTVMRLEAKRLEKVLEVVERVVARHDWLLPSGFSAVDTNVGYGVEIARRFVPLDWLPNVKAYHARLARRPAFRAALAEDGESQIYTRDFYEAPDD
ncbi:glutathione S-transferase [Maritimibacter sp. 55A14]|uniref:glutathione S-transferase family protein n=1 Tax=Maritimibacter sp. 55A14 TaxID=2174844 RepID=UPI000D613EBE|nr:glutathione S-transferase family protein [Maritimibacter sp. 55A14]PWE33949.1 glutathione S-transferase [Maritimibacter sp. 55A14]